MAKSTVQVVKYTCDACGWTWQPRKAQPVNKYGASVRMCPRCKRAVNE